MNQNVSYTEYLSVMVLSIVTRWFRVILNKFDYVYKYLGDTKIDP